MKHRGIKELIDILANECYVSGKFNDEEYLRLKNLAQLLHDKGKNAGTRAGLEELFEDSIEHPDFKGVYAVPEIHPMFWTDKDDRLHRVKAEPIDPGTELMSPKMLYLMGVQYVDYKMMLRSIMWMTYRRTGKLA